MAELQRNQLWRHKPQDWREIDGFSCQLACGCHSAPYAPDGHPYGRQEPGSYITCGSLHGQQKVLGCTRVPRPQEPAQGRVEAL